MEKISADDVTGITLLSTEEAERVPIELRKFSNWWWLRSPSKQHPTSGKQLQKQNRLHPQSWHQKNVVRIGANGSICYNGNRVDNDLFSVRPAVRFRNAEVLGLKKMDEFDLFGRTWTVVEENLALCNSAIGQLAFRKDWMADDASCYEASDVKKYIEDWLTHKISSK